MPLPVQQARNFHAFVSKAIGKKSHSGLDFKSHHPEMELFEQLEFKKTGGELVADVTTTPAYKAYYAKGKESFPLTVGADLKWLARILGIKIDEKSNFHDKIVISDPASIEALQKAGVLVESSQPTPPTFFQSSEKLTKPQHRPAQSSRSLEDPNLVITEENEKLIDDFDALRTMLGSMNLKLTGNLISSSGTLKISATITTHDGEKLTKVEIKFIASKVFTITNKDMEIRDNGVSLTLDSKNLAKLVASVRAVQQSVDNLGQQVSKPAQSSQSLEDSNLTITGENEQLIDYYDALRTMLGSMNLKLRGDLISSSGTLQISATITTHDGKNITKDALNLILSKGLAVPGTDLKIRDDGVSLTLDSQSLAQLVAPARAVQQAVDSLGPQVSKHAESSQSLEDTNLTITGENEQLIDDYDTLRTMLGSMNLKLRGDLISSSGTLQISATITTHDDKNITKDALNLILSKVLAVTRKDLKIRDDGVSLTLDSKSLEQLVAPARVMQQEERGPGFGM